MKYILYNENFETQGSFSSIQELRNFLCDRKYDIQCDKDIGCTFDYIKHIKWHFDICLLYTSPSPRDVEESRMPSSA